VGRSRVGAGANRSPACVFCSQPLILVVARCCGCPIELAKLVGRQISKRAVRKQDARRPAPSFLARSLETGLENFCRRVFQEVSAILTPSSKRTIALRYFSSVLSELYFLLNKWLSRLASHQRSSQPKEALQKRSNPVTASARLLGCHHSFATETAAAGLTCTLYLL
jgi:hypothetical protein